MPENDKPFFVAVDEQETIINFSRCDDLAEIWTSDKTMMTRFDKFVESGEWILKEVQYVHKSIVAKVYKAPKTLVMGRAKRQVMSEERKQQQAERMKAIRNNQLSQNQNIS